MGVTSRRTKLMLSSLRPPSRCKTMVADDIHESHDAVLRGKIYIDTLPADILPVRRLLEKYSGIRGKDVDRHIHQVRDRLWEIHPHVFVGHFRFLSLGFTSDPFYHAALRRLLLPKPTVRLLDLGCCVGQMLRQLAFDGVDSTKLYGIDVEPRFLDLGYELFRDKGKLRATLIAGDLLKPGETGAGHESLRALDGMMNIIHATSFFHLFAWEDQLRAAERMVRFLNPADSDVMIFGRQVGSTMPGERRGPNGDKRYLHDQETWQALWDEVGKLTGTSWRAVLDPLEKEGGNTDGVDDTLRRVRFSVHRA
ncbi:hypothetical protein F4775DRAFT_296650 [Biscogniauxia sp. FL1348]|nr:hypothetical protein F4775DRAFT_296650 [Biscogniauxia sp. FL1348]